MEHSKTVIVGKEKWSLMKVGFLFIFYITSFISIGQVQGIPATFQKTVDSLIAAAPKTYRDIDLVLKPNRRDTIFMNYFVKVAEHKSYAAGMAYGLNELGTKYRNISQYNKAIALHKKALAVSTKAKNLEFRVFSLNMLGVVYRRTYSIRTAMDYNQEALELAETVKNPSSGLKRSINVSLNSIGNLYQLLEQYDLAIKQFQKSMELEKELGNTLGLAINYQNIGDCLEKQGKLNEALENYRTSLAYNEQLNSDFGKVICKNSIAQIYIKQAKLKEALELLEPTLLASQALGDKYITSSVHINLGWLMMLLKRYDQAEKNMLQGLEEAKKHHLPGGASQACKLLSQLEQHKGDYKSALAYTKQAEKYDNEILNGQTIRYVNDMIFRSEAEKKNNQIKLLAKEKDNAELRLRKNQTTLLVSGIALALLAGIFYILYRQYQLKNEKKLLTLEQSMLRSQMNPHFLFNSLNSIKLYIINNEKKNAVHYLNKFSKLVRKILESSSLKEIPLEEELETVTLYMNIENIRFSHEIDFKIIVDDAINTQNVKIPSLILQPFLENALWHGLSSKEGYKEIRLHVSQKKMGFIDISITDNGLGREAAEIIKKGKVLKRKSVGIDITKERLGNFSKDYQNTFKLEIVDLYDADQKAAGTRVILHIPTI